METVTVSQHRTRQILNQSVNRGSNAEDHHKYSACEIVSALLFKAVGSKPHEGL